MTERLSVERLGEPTGTRRACLPDCISSTVYGSEEILFVLVKCGRRGCIQPLLLPITLAVIVVLLFVTLSYREVVMVYTCAGGSYVVARENFGVKVAQIAAVALNHRLHRDSGGAGRSRNRRPDLGRAGLSQSESSPSLDLHGRRSRFHVLRQPPGDPRGGSGTFAIPTYLFVTATRVIDHIGSYPRRFGQLHAHVDSRARRCRADGEFPERGLLYGAGIIIVLRAFANGGFVAHRPRGDLERGLDLRPARGAPTPDAFL